MRPMLIGSLLAVIFTLSLFAVSAQAEIPSITCDYLEEEAVIVRYEYRNRRIVLVSGKTGDVLKELETSLETSRFYVQNFSPDCRYLVGRVKGQGHVVWDLTTTTRIGNFEVFTPNTDLWWDERSQYLIVPASNDGTYLWQMASNNKIKLNDNPCGFHSVEWNYDRQQVLAVSRMAINGAWCSYNIDSRVVEAYDVNNGSLVAAYEGRGPGYNISFTTVANGRFILIVNDNIGPASVWDRETGEVKIANIGFGRGVNGLRFRLSPDGRYLVTTTRRTIEVWDLQALAPEFEDHQPTRVMTSADRAAIRAISFIDNAVLETRHDGEVVRRWNVATGEEIIQ